MNTVERTQLWRKKSVSSPLGLLQTKTKTHYCRHLGVGSIHLKEQIKHQYNTWLGFITRHNWKPHWKLALRYGYLCSWTCIYMCRQLFSHVGFCEWGIYFFYLKHTHTHTPFVSIALLHSLLSHHVASPLAGTQHTPCIIADIKTTCQNTSTLAPLQSWSFQSTGLCFSWDRLITDLLFLVILECSESKNKCQHHWCFVKSHVSKQNYPKGEWQIFKVFKFYFLRDLGEKMVKGESAPDTMLLL